MWSDEGNRTLVVGLGSLCSTIELHPHQRFNANKYILLTEYQQLFIN